MQHQTEFLLPVDMGRHALLQIAIPAQQESVLTSSLIRELSVMLALSPN